MCGIVPDDTVVAAVLAFDGVFTQTSQRCFLVTQGCGFAGVSVCCSTRQFPCFVVKSVRFDAPPPAVYLLSSIQCGISASDIM